MANIELVIRIPEDEYQNILHTGKTSFCTVNAIEAGTLLPKGHGRLIDADATIKEFGEWTDEWDDFAIGCLKSADTIIEANTESEDK